MKRFILFSFLLLPLILASSSFPTQIFAASNKKATIQYDGPICSLGLSECDISFSLFRDGATNILWSIEAPDSLAYCEMPVGNPNICYKWFRGALRITKRIKVTVKYSLEGLSYTESTNMRIILPTRYD